MVFEAFRLEMLKNLWFLKLWGHLDRDENDFDSFFSPKMRKKEHEHNRRTQPRKCDHGPLLRASVNAPVATDRELLSPKIKKAF